MGLVSWKAPGLVCTHFLYVIIDVRHEQAAGINRQTGAAFADELIQRKPGGLRRQIPQRDVHRPGQVGKPEKNVRCRSIVHNSCQIASRWLTGSKLPTRPARWSSVQVCLGNHAWNAPRGAVAWPLADRSSVPRRRTTTSQFIEAAAHARGIKQRFVMLAAPGFDGGDDRVMGIGGHRMPCFSEGFGAAQPGLDFLADQLFAAQRLRQARSITAASTLRGTMTTPSRSPKTKSPGSTATPPTSTAHR